MTRVEEKIQNLRNLIWIHQEKYNKGKPEISDREFDGLLEELRSLENKYPEFYDDQSPTVRVGSDIDTSLTEVKHKIPVLSLDKAYHNDGLIQFFNRIQKMEIEDTKIVIEEKIDGISLVLYYQNGVLDKAVTRGNGFIGNDVTLNVQTIADIPLKINYHKELIVRGEVYLRKDSFAEIIRREKDIEYANPRNLAAGLIRRKKSKETARYPLNFFSYEGFFTEENKKTHFDILMELKKLGFLINSHTGFFYIKEWEEIREFINQRQNQRKELNYDIDGLVLKTDSINLREKLGYTGHHPRWAIAYKFDAPLAKTRVQDIQFQIGRGGRITPVAILKPVLLSGSTIQRATLHNEDYIQSLEIGKGDWVTISKRGDVIPAVEEVLEKSSLEYEIIEFPKNCPSCRTKLKKIGSHHYCVNKDCPAILLNSLIFFASRSMMDIRNLGEQTIKLLFDNGFVKKPSDFYKLDYQKLLDFDGYKEKKISRIIESIEISKKKPFSVVLSSLGFRELGPKMVQLLIENGYNSIDKLIAESKKSNRESFTRLDGIGDILADRIISVFSDKKNIQLFDELKQAGLNLEEEVDSIKDDLLRDTSWVITGSFELFKPREKAAELIKKYGGKILSAVSSKTDYLLMGENPGSKKDKAQVLNIKIVSEQELIEMINNKVRE